MSQDYTPEEIEEDVKPSTEEYKDPKPPANTWPKIVAAVASALCTVSSTLYFTMKNQYNTERKDRLELLELNKTEKIAHDTELKEKQKEIDNCGSKTIKELQEQVEAVKNIKFTTITSVNEVVTDNKITSDNIKNIKKATKELTQKISKNE